ncbi:TMEM175 family protein [Geodermatophilus sp. URMC 61]|uniref:TMEM175 family protein n=1 Tax=Geodermatophilus sp. URMC 61 TaxID=3423411 RepID=UPI00406CD8F8
MRTDRGLDRLITFLDAIVAIAITLLVLPLVDVLPDEGEVVDLDALLVAEAGRFGAFALSFAVIAQLWLVHHRIVERVGSYDRPFVLVNLVWTLTIVLLPFATEVTAVYGDERLAIAVYIGTMTVSSACLTLLTLLLVRRPYLRRAGADPAEDDLPGALLTTGTFVLALVVGVAVPAIGYLSLLLLLLPGPARRALPRRAD